MCVRVRNEGEAAAIIKDPPGPKRRRTLGGATPDPFLPMRANSPMDDSNGLVQLLARMKDEHTRSTAAIEALDRSAVESGRRIADQRDMMARMGEEVEQVQFKTVQSAGSARQVSEVRAHPHRYHTERMPSHASPEQPPWKTLLTRMLVCLGRSLKQSVPSAPRSTLSPHGSRQSSRRRLPSSMPCSRQA